MNRIMMVVLMVVYSGMTAWAAGGGGGSVGGKVALPDSLPITSQMELTSWAKARVSYLFQYAGSQGPVVPGGKASVAVSTNNPDVRVIINLLRQNMLGFAVTVPEQQMYLGVSAMDDTGHQLFSGQNNFNLVPGKACWVVPEGAKKVVMSLSDVVYIPAPGAAGASVWKDGQWVGVGADGGGIYFPKSMCIGTKGVGMLTIWASDGTGRVYDMATGKVAIAEPVNMSADASIARLTCLDDPSLVYDQPVSKNGQGHRGWYQVKITSKRMVAFFGMTSEDEAATTVNIRPVHGVTSSYKIVEKGMYIELDVGVYDIWCGYPTFDPDVFIPQWWWDGGNG